jgi:hypothetical protein
VTKSALHIIKLCVGADSVEDLADWQTRLMKRRRGKPPYHTTRMTPKRADELLGGGSMYWVIKGVIRVRQKLTAIEPFTDDDGIGRCRLVFDPELVLVEPVPRRPFQGWRYLRAKDAPPDLPRAGEPGADMPADMRADLRALGLL